MDNFFEPGLASDSEWQWVMPTPKPPTFAECLDRVQRDNEVTILFDGWKLVCRDEGVCKALADALIHAGATK